MRGIVFRFIVLCSCHYACGCFKFSRVSADEFGIINILSFDVLCSVGRGILLRKFMRFSRECSRFCYYS